MDPDDNFLIILEGCKRVRMCEPSPVSRRYPNPLGSKGKTIQSRVDLDAKSGRQKFPEFEFDRMIDVKVKAGEMLFIPAFFWHQVTSLENTLSVNIFFGDCGRANYITKILKYPQREAFMYWLTNIMEQNRPYDSFTRIVRELPYTLKQFFLKQWHEEPSDGQIEEIVMDLKNRAKLDKESISKALLKFHSSPHNADAKDNTIKIKNQINSDFPVAIMTHVEATEVPEPEQTRECSKSKHAAVLKIRGLKWR